MNGTPNPPSSAPLPSPNRRLPAPTFDFDEWANLFKTNPVAFEARRKAVLAIELAKAGPRAARARICLTNLEAAMVGKTAEERSRVALLWMADSADQLQRSLLELTAKIQGGVR